MFTKERESGAPYWHRLACAIIIPHGEGEEGVAGQVTVLDGQRQPLIPTAKGIRLHKSYNVIMYVSYLINLEK